MWIQFILEQASSGLQYLAPPSWLHFLTLEVAVMKKEVCLVFALTLSDSLDAIIDQMLIIANNF